MLIQLLAAHYVKLGFGRKESNLFLCTEFEADLLTCYYARDCITLCYLVSYKWEFYQNEMMIWPSFWVANPVDESLCIVAIIRCLVASRRDFDKRLDDYTVTQKPWFWPS
jgi:hypothetical protein